MQKAITYVGLDLHKDTIVVSLAEAGLRGSLREVREYGRILNTPGALKAMAAKLAAKGNELRFCYEAGPCGYGVQRQLTWHQADICHKLSWIAEACDVTKFRHDCGGGHQRYATQGLQCFHNRRPETIPVAKL